MADIWGDSVTEELEYNTLTLLKYGFTQPEISHYIQCEKMLLIDQIQSWAVEPEGLTPIEARDILKKNLERRKKEPLLDIRALRV